MVFIFFISLAANATENIDFKNLIKNAEVLYQVEKEKFGGCIEDSKFTKLIRNILIKLETASGRVGLKVEACLVKSKQFNATSFANKKIVIHLGLIQTVFTRANKLKEKYKKTETNQIFEGLLAAILGHELGHIAEGHNVRKDYATKGLAKAESIANFSKQQELDADLAGYVILQKASYRKRWAIESLKLIRDFESKCKTSLDCSQLINLFYARHPSASVRISALEKNNHLLKTTAEFEFAFNRVQIGGSTKQIKKACRFIKRARSKYNSILLFKQAYAVCSHKLWLSTVNPKEQQFEPMLLLPQFQDEMLAGKESSGKALAIPGDKVLFFKAIRAYQKVEMNLAEPWFLSSFSTLLIYSQAQADNAKSLQFAKKAYSLAQLNQGYFQKIATANNYGLVLALSGSQYFSKAEQFFNEASELSNKAVRKLVEQEEIDLPTSEEVYASLVPVLNLSLLSIKRNDSNIELAKTYFKLSNKENKWIKFLSSELRLPSRLAMAARPSVGGVKVGMSEKKLLRIWRGKKNTRKSKQGKIYQFEKHGIEVFIQNKRIHRIKVLPSSSLLVSGIGIGSSLNSITKKFRDFKGMAGHYLVFSKKNKQAHIGFAMAQNKVYEIVLF